jgi:hypothetical protein
MSDELRLPDDLAACEARLAAQSLPATAINRDELMYRAGWAAGVESTRLAALNPPPWKGGARGGIRLAAASLASAAVAASLAVAATLHWGPAELTRVVVETPRHKADAMAAVAAPRPSTSHLIADVPARMERNVRPASDVGLLGLRLRALNQTSLLSDRVTASNADASDTSAKSARELLDEMLPTASGKETQAWPWRKNFVGDSI